MDDSKDLKKGKSETVVSPDAASPPELSAPGIAALLQTQVAQCVGVVKDLAEYLMAPGLISHERIHVAGAIGQLIQCCSNVGVVIAKLHGGADGTRHTVVVEDRRREGKGEGVRKS